VDIRFIVVPPPDGKCVLDGMPGKLVVVSAGVADYLPEKRAI
jgi:hypothetical protein